LKPSINFIGDFAPLKSDEKAIRIVHWEGMIYRREALIARLPPRHRLGRFDDHQLIIAAIVKWGDKLHQNLEGRYLLIFCIGEASYAVRGAYDSPQLFYANIDNRLVCSLSLELLLSRLPRPVRISISALVHQFSFFTSDAEKTPFCDIYSLEAGQALVFTQTSEPIKLSPFRPYRNITPVSDPRVVERWREVLVSTLNEFACVQGNIGLFMSGGLDSGALATIAAYNNIPIQTITFGLANYPAEDESAYAASLAKSLNIEHHHLDIESECFQEVDSFPLTLKRPVFNPYQRMINEGYEYAHQLGIKFLWTGSVGDDIYAPKRNLLKDLWRHRKFKEMLAAMTKMRSIGAPIPHAYKTLINYIVNRTPRDLEVPNYINSEISESRSTKLSHPQLVGNGSNTHHRSIVFHYDNINGLSYEQEFTNRYDLQRVHPFMHPALIELGMQTPAYIAHAVDQNKSVIRSALAGIAPENLLKRNRVGVLNNYFLSGWNANYPRIQSILFDNSASWPMFVKKEAMVEMLNSKTDRGYMLASRCLALELWLNLLRSKGLVFQFH